MVAPKLCKECGKPPLVLCSLVQGPGFGVMAGVSKGRAPKFKFIVACARTCVSDIVRGNREEAVAAWNAKRKETVA